MAEEVDIIEKTVQDSTVNRNELLASALREYLALMERGSYFEAHEVLEDAWHPLRKSGNPLKNLLKGLINGAIAFEHLKRNRRGAARKACKVMNAFERYKYLVREADEAEALLQAACHKVEQLKEEKQNTFNLFV